MNGFPIPAWYSKPGSDKRIKALLCGESEGGKPWPVYYVHCCNCGTDGPVIETRGRNVPPEAARNASIDLWNWRAK